MTNPTPPRRRRRSGRPPAAGAPHTGSTPAAPASRQLRPEPAAAVSPAADPNATFSDLGVPTPLITALARQGIDAPFPIQVATLPDTLAGRDVLGRGKTGSGKTLAFSLPMITRLTGGSSRPRKPRALVLVPTRELANQVLAVVRPLAEAVRLTSCVVFGGVSQHPQVKALASGVDILIACPGRLEDLMGQGHCDLSSVEITVLDEADHMADLGFLPGVKRILDRTPENGQRMLFSATLDNGVDILVARYLHQPTTHSVDPAVAPVSTMTHHVFAVSPADKVKVVHELAAGMERCLLFMRTKHTAKKLAKQLTAAGIPAVDLHGNLSQNRREQNLAAFSDGSVRVLVATDIAARGIHVDDVALVVHVDPPTEHKAYLHRSGRTARAGAGGTVITLATPDQARDVSVLAKQAGIRPKTVTVGPGSAEITELVGPPAPYVDPPILAETSRSSPNHNRGGGRGSRSGQAATTRAGSAGVNRGGAPSTARSGARPPQARRRSGR